MGKISWIIVLCAIAGVLLAGCSRAEYSSREDAEAYLKNLYPSYTIRLSETHRSPLSLFAFRREWDFTIDELPGHTFTVASIKEWNENHGSYEYLADNVRDTLFQEMKASFKEQASKEDRALFLAPPADAESKICFSHGYGFAFSDKFAASLEESNSQYVMLHITSVGQFPQVSRLMDEMRAFSKENTPLGEIQFCVQFDVPEEYRLENGIYWGNKEGKFRKAATKGEDFQKFLDSLCNFSARSGYVPDGLTLDRIEDYIRRLMSKDPENTRDLPAAADGKITLLLWNKEYRAVSTVDPPEGIYMSIGAAKRLLDSQGMKTEGTPDHFRVIGADGHSYEFSNAFTAVMPKAKDVNLAYYLLDGKKTDLYRALYEQCIPAQLWERISGKKLHDSLVNL